MEQKTARALAYEALFAVLEKDAYANLALQASFRMPLSPEDRKFLTELVYGTLRHLQTLAWHIDKISSRPLRKLDAPVRILLLLGLDQLLYMNSVPDSAAVNETVKIAKRVTHAGNVKFVNAVLRNWLRKKDTLRLPTAEEAPVLSAALSLNMPTWLIRRWQKAFGAEKATAVLQAFQDIRPTDIRVNPLKISKETLMKELSEMGSAPSEIPGIADGLSLKDAGPFFRARFLADGTAYVQNRASMLPAVVLAPEAGETVLDMCAAPGSKTTQIGAMMGNTGRVVCWDLYPHKVKLLAENAKRLGLANVFPSVHDATKIEGNNIAAFNRVLLDAPCSGLGVLGRKIEIRWRRKENDLAAFPPLQEKLLDAAAKAVKPGGILVYSTCTLERAENEEQVAAFLARHENFEQVPFTAGEKNAPTGMLTLWPDTDGCDGFFVAKLRRKA